MNRECQCFDVDDIGEMVGAKCSSDGGASAVTTDCFGPIPSSPSRSCSLPSDFAQQQFDSDDFILHDTVYRSVSWAPPNDLSTSRFQSVADVWKGHEEKDNAVSARSQRRRPPSIPKLFVIEPTSFLLPRVRAEEALDHVIAQMKKATLTSSRCFTCDTDVDRPAHLVRVVANMDLHRVDFCVRVFMSDANVPLVEFQRRSGDALIWSRVYRTLAAAITGSAEYKVVDPPRMPASHAAAVLNDISAHLHPLAQMIQSPYRDMQTEACKALADVIGGVDKPEKVARVLNDGQMLEPLLKLACVDDDIVRCTAVSTLAIICERLRKDSSDSFGVIHKVLHPVVSVLQHERVSFSTAHIRRQCVRALANLSEISACAKEIAATGAVSLLRECGKSADVSISYPALFALSNIDTAITVA